MPVPVDLLFDFVKRERSLSTSFVKELHALLLAHQDAATSGRTAPFAPTG